VSGIVRRMEIHPLTEARLGDLARLFGTTAVTNR
jgi:hypothetical protein